MTIEEARAKIQGYYDRKIWYMDRQYEIRSSLGYRLSDIHLGYYYNSEGIVQSWQWKVLDVMDNAVLLLSKTLLTGVEIHDSDAGGVRVGVTWENCTGRQYLNSDFIADHFNEEAASFILPANIVTADNNEEATMSSPFAEVYCQGKGCGQTTDKVFLLSIEECRKYGYIGEGSTGGFDTFNWLRSPGYTYEHFAYVKNGMVYPEGQHYSLYEGEGYMRPALFYDIRGLKARG